MLHGHALEQSRPARVTLTKCLLQREELEYHLEDDVKPYVAAAVSRWNNPEVTAMFADTLRTQKLLYATKMNFLTQNSFKLDLQAIANAQPEDFVHLQKYSTLGQAYSSSAEKADLGIKVDDQSELVDKTVVKRGRLHMFHQMTFRNPTSDYTETCC